MAERKPLSKKIRFEVFKRDNFTCQYCGHKAPEYILEVDHIDPVKHKGDNDPFNLITSCFDCNRGKADRKLSDTAVLDKQRQKIEDLNIRRQQLEMLLAWKDELISNKNMEANYICNYISNKLESKFKPTESWRININSYLSKLGHDRLIEMIDDVFFKISFSMSKYGITEKTVEIFWSILRAKIIGETSTPQETKKYLHGILYNKFQYTAYRCDVETMIDRIINSPAFNENRTEIISAAKKITSVTDFLKKMNEFIAPINDRPSK